MDNRKEVFLTDLAALAQPRANLSEIRELDKWETVPYKTVERSGCMLAALKYVKPEPVFFSPKLKGWYKIFVCMGNNGSFGSLYVNLQLTNDKTFSQLCPEGNKHDSFEEIYWKSADMTDQDIALSKFHTGLEHSAMLAWLRFVPMSDVETAAYQYDQERTDTKRIYATHDMHGHLAIHGPQKLSDWRCLVENYRDSDVYSLSMENITIFDGEPTTGDYRTLGYYRECDKIIQEGIKKQFTFEMLNDLVHYGQDMGLHMNISMRMGAWGIEFPYDQMYFANTFIRDHQDLRCVDRTGVPVETLSYSYPAVQDYVLDQFSRMAAADCDGVEMIFTRGVPYVLFEQPFLDRFKSRYGDLDPHTLPVSDERICGLFCAVMTDFVRKLRKKLDAERASRGQKPIKIIARVHASIENGRQVGIDVSTWAKEKLIDVIVSYPMFIVEDLEADVWQNDTHKLIDPDKYRHYINTASEAPIKRFGDFEYDQFVDKIKRYGKGDPLTEKDRIASFKALGLPVYFEILPRQMPTEEYKRRALALYENGAEGISLWDTYNRAPNRAQWTMVRRLGHKEDLASYENGEGEYFRYIRILNIAGQNISLYKPAWGG